MKADDLIPVSVDDTFVTGGNVRKPRAGALQGRGARGRWSADAVELTRLQPQLHTI